jgi:hypothetical protein
MAVAVVEHFNHDSDLLTLLIDYELNAFHTGSVASEGPLHPEAINMKNT